MRTILFICTGNTCRSPMAEALARKWIAEQNPDEFGDLFVASAGVGAIDGLPTTPETLRALAKFGVEEFRGSSKRLTREMIQKADLVLCMTGGQVDLAAELVHEDPHDLAKVQRVDPDHDLEDPIGLGQEVYDALAGKLARLIPRRLREVLVP